MIPADLDIGDDDSPDGAGVRPTLARTPRLHPVLVVTGGGRPARHDPEERPALPVAGAIRRANHGCPHCVGLTGTCCQCHGSRLVSTDVAQRNGNWLWAFPGCACQVCRKLTLMLDAIVEPAPGRASNKADASVSPNPPAAHLRP
jgi:hypothetical protein